MNDINPEIFQLLQQEDWNDIGRRLTLFSIRRATFYGWLNSDTQLLAGRDFTIGDIVQHVILKTINGDRKWDPKKGSLFAWLKYQVRSVMDAWIKSEPGKHEVSFGDDIEDDEEIEVYSGVPGINDVKDMTAIQPEESLINSVIEQEANKRNSMLVNRIFQVIDNDPELVKLIEYVCETGELRPRIVANDLGVSVEDINNQKKRLFRHLSQLELSDRKGIK